MLQERGMRFKYLPTPEPAQEQEPPNRSNSWHQEGVHNALKQVDLAVIWIPKNLDGLELTARPGTRLVSWMSNGIPTVFYPMQSYLDICSFLGEDREHRCLENAATTIEEAVSRLDMLGNDPD